MRVEASNAGKRRLHTGYAPENFCGLEETSRCRESKVAARQSCLSIVPVMSLNKFCSFCETIGETIFAARYVDVSHGFLGL